MNIEKGFHSLIKKKQLVKVNKLPNISCLGIEPRTYSM